MIKAEIMNHVISVMKRDVSDEKLRKLELALSILNANNAACLATDKSGEFIEIFVLNANEQRAEQMKFFAMGFLDMPEAE